MVSLKLAGKKKPRQHGSMVSLAEYGSFGVEFLTLSTRTGNSTYAQKAEAIYRYLLSKQELLFKFLACFRQCISRPDCDNRRSS